MTRDIVVNSSGSPGLVKSDVGATAVLVDELDAPATEAVT
jgi:hypothetical protein